MFHRKVHPENWTGAQKCDKYQKNENKKKTMNEVVHGEEDIMIHPKRAVSKENIMRQYYKIALGCEDSSDNKEHWIKTDADCKHTIIQIPLRTLCIYIYHYHD